ncbi:Maf family protein [Salinicola rhizosphaerae]|uniref:7-methyl-GTP pyrophosphatase n=1 Tax=Salinicola rhizosphaerae TaxID=1443141 RepID=A0ABQ3DMI8_9GAMM|nr:Maf family protein [Salinicola rhizosphaerae]GHB08105.1 Maf-like protein [Salinicola rhizosphaerae]
MPRLVLASSSRYRRQLLDRLEIPYAWSAPDIDESRREGEDAVTLAHRLALSKAQAVAEEYPEHLIIGSDQLALFEDDILGKPGDFATACANLARFSGKRVRFMTGLALIDTAAGRHRVVHDTYDVLFRNLSSSEIESYVSRDEPYDSSGSFRMEGLGIALFERFEGSDPNTLIGMPLIKLCELLREAGVDPLTKTGSQ